MAHNTSGAPLPLPMQGPHSRPQPVRRATGRPRARGARIGPLPHPIHSPPPLHHSPGRRTLQQRSFSVAARQAGSRIPGPLWCRRDVQVHLGIAGDGSWGFDLQRSGQKGMAMLFTTSKGNSPDMFIQAMQNKVIYLYFIIHSVSQSFINSFI